VPLPTRPPNVPAEASWNASENEWELGTKSNGKCVGTWTWWRPSGAIVCRSTFGDDGTLDGPFQRFHPNGEVCLEGTYSKNRPVGIHRWHFCSGKSDQPYFFAFILSDPPDEARTVVVDYKDGTGLNVDLIDTAHYFDAAGVEIEPEDESVQPDDEAQATKATTKAKKATAKTKAKKTKAKVGAKARTPQKAKAPKKASRRGSSQKR